MPLINAPIGTRVLISEESENYRYYNGTQSQGREGTIISYPDTFGWDYRVQWDNGHRNVYRATDLKEISKPNKKKASGFKKFQHKLTK